MAPPRKEAGSSGRPLPPDLAPNNNFPPAASKSGKRSSPTKKSGTSAINSNSAKVSADKVAKTPDKSKEPFRFRWMKKLSPSKGETLGRDENNADAVQESKRPRAKASTNNNSRKKTGGSTSPTKLETTTDFNAPAAAKKAPSTPRKFLFGTKPQHQNKGDSEMKYTIEGDQYVSDEYEDYGEEEEGSFDQTPRSGAPSEWTSPADEYGLIGPDHPSVPKSLNNMEKARKKTKGPVDKNGRHHGRELVHWHRARMMEKLLLTLQYECQRANIVIPWDKIVHRLRPGSSGPAATQMLNKMRDILIVEGHMIPPPLGKPSIPQDPTIRGLIRDFSSEIPTKTRVVRWDEKVEHRKESLQVPGVVRGSGNYVRGADGRCSTTGRSKQRPRIKLPEEYVKGVEAAKISFARDSQRKRRDRAKRAKRDREEKEDLVDPADLPSDEEWDPNVTKKARTSRRVRKSAVKVEIQSDGEAADISKAPSMMRFSANDNSISENSSLPIKLLLAPEKLAKWPAGPSGIALSGLKALQNENAVDFDDDVDATDEDIEHAEADQEYEEMDEDYQDATEEEGVQLEEQEYLSPNSLFVKQFGSLPDLSYRGFMEHGTLDEYCAAMKAGTDPKLNGHKYKNSSGFMDPSLIGHSLHMTYAESAALAQAKSQASDSHHYCHPAGQTLFRNENEFAADGIHHPVPTHVHAHLRALGLDPEDDPFVDNSLHTSSYAPQLYDMAQLAGNHTPPYLTFATQTSNSASIQASSTHQLDGLRRDFNDQFAGYSEMSAQYPYVNQFSNNSILASSSSTKYRQAKSDFVNAPGRIYEDPEEHAGQSTEMMEYGDSWNNDNPSQMGAHMGSQDHGHGQEHHVDENYHPSSLPSPGNVDYDDQASYGATLYHQ